MEKENFDEELKNRIKQIFEDYQDETANEGWNRLREKFPEKNRRNFFFWWFAAAAVLLLGILLFWFSSSNIKNFGSRTKTVKQQPKESGLNWQQVGPVRKDETLNQNIASTKKLSGIKVTLLNTKKTPVKTVSPIIARRLTNQFQQKKTERAEVGLKNQVKSETNVQANTVFTGIKKVSADSSAKKVQINLANSAASSPKEKPEAAAQKVIIAKRIGVDSSEKQQQIAIRKASAAVPTYIDSLEKKQPKLIAKAANPVIKKTVIVKKTGPAKKLSEEKPSKFSLGLYAGTHLNYASGSNNQLGLGAGVSTDFRVAKSLKFSTGLGLLQDNLSYAQNIPASSQAAASRYALTSASVTPILVTQASNLKRMDASLLVLDIPLNLTYIILPGKNSISFSAGLSSNTFVREVYDYQYNTSLAAATSGTNSTSLGNPLNLRSSTSFKNFNFAKTINLAAGFAYPLGKNKLQVEPFLKYPLGGMGSQKLLFGSAGINLKMNFQSFKK